MGAAHSTVSEPDSVRPGADGVIWQEKPCDSKDHAPIAALHETVTTKPPSQRPHERPIHTLCFRHDPTIHKTKSLPPHEEYSKNRPAWGPGATSTPRPAPWTRHVLNRVAEMPERKPLPGHEYEYLSILDRCPAPVRFCECAPCQKALRSSRLYRQLASIWHTYKALNGSDMSVRRRWFTFFAGGQKHKGRITYGIEPREVECPVPGRDDWTTDWTWALAVRHRDPAGEWSVDGRFYFHWMHQRLQEGVPWRNPQATEERETSGPVRIFADESKPPRWCAAIRMERENADVPYVADPWDYFTPKTAEM